MPNISVMIKPASSLCNLSCKYCFYHSLSSAREAFSYGIMDRQTTKNIVQSALNLADNGSIYFAFQGGEPLIAGIDYFYNFVAEVEIYNTKNIKIYYTLQTNGTLVDETWIAFFKKHNFLIGLSIDGDAKANKNRTFIDGKESFKLVMDTASNFLNAGVEFNILTVITKYVAQNIEDIYKFFVTYGFKYLQFIPMYRPFDKSGDDSLFLTIASYGEFLTKLFKLYVKDYVTNRYISIRQFDNYVALYRKNKAEQCGMNGFCSHQLVVEANGNVYPCDFYCLDKYLLGNINTTPLSELVVTKIATDFIKESLPVNTQCEECKYYFLCRGGGCKRAKADENYCASYKYFFDKTINLFKVFD